MKPLLAIPSGGHYHQTKSAVKELRLNSVCEEAACPNKSECWPRKAIAIQILGKLCTRACRFCGEARGNPNGIVDQTEPKRAALACVQLELKHIVITMPARDDLEDGGARILAQTIQEIKKESPQTWIEVLTSDFEGRGESLKALASAHPHVFAHNLETTRYLTPKIRSKATYEKSLRVLKMAKELGLKTKSGLMVGLGETIEELQETFDDLANMGIGILTIGQYFSPSPKHYQLKRYYSEQEFKELGDLANSAGICYVFSGALIRSSHYKAQIFNPGGRGDVA